MRVKLWTLGLATLSLVGAAACAGDTGDGGGDGDQSGAPSPIVHEVNPEPGESNFFYQSDLRVEFNIVPEGATIALADASGAAIDGTTTEASSGRVLEFDPGSDLVPSTAYVMTVTWNSDDSPLAVNFSTGPYGNSVTTPSDMVGKTYNIDLAAATFIEPPGVGPILQSQIGDIAILFSPTSDSDFDAGTLHIRGGIGEVSGGSVIQDECSETLAFTYGPDGAVGGNDDTPAQWDNPVMQLGPTDLPIAVQGINATIEDLIITGTFHPELSDLKGGLFSGTVDTRPLAPELDPEGGEGAICELVEETIGTPCITCSTDGQPFCLAVEATDVAADYLASVTLVDRSCKDIIDDYIATMGDAEPTCKSSAEAFDVDANSDGVMDGTYPECQLWVDAQGS